MKNISANSLFHFTNSLSKLVGIITKGFLPFYALEQFLNGKIENRVPELFNEFAIPMVCFCDIRLTQIQNHTKTYGNYAIGLKKEWGIRFNINPILYMQENSAPSYIYADLLDKFMVFRAISYSEINQLTNGLSNSIYDIASYIKPYKGKIWDKKGLKYSNRNVIFYNEREWRYVPPLQNFNKKNNKTTHLPPYIRKEQYLDSTFLEDCNKALQHYYHLQFQPADINYIVVMKNDEVEEILNLINTMLPDYTTEEKDILKTKITTIERINHDF